MTIVVQLPSGKQAEQDELLCLTASMIQPVSMKPKIGMMVLSVDLDGQESFIAIAIQRKGAEALRRTLDAFLKTTAN